MEIKRQLLVIFLLLSSISCATTFDKQGRLHKIQRGETIWVVARAYRIDVQMLAEYNNIEDPQDIRVGQKLYIPARSKKAGYKRLPGESLGVSPGGGRKGGKQIEEERRKISVHHGKFRWPVNGPVLSGFGYRNGRRHDGIDIKAAKGTPIHAAGDGSVVFAGKMRGYGNLILIRHTGDYFTAYAHNSKNSVKKGEKVKRGAVVGTVGTTGRTTGPHLHFEIRHGQRARNPLFFLPKKRN